MTDHKQVIDNYRQKTERPIKSEMVVFRCTPEEYDLLMKVYGSMAGIRDFALASTDTDQGQLDVEYRLKSDVGGEVDQDADQG